MGEAFDPGLTAMVVDIVEQPSYFRSGIKYMFSRGHRMDATNFREAAMGGDEPD